MPSILRTALLALAFFTCGSAFAAEGKQRLSFVVVGSDQALDKRFEDGISARLLQANIEISDRWPQGKLFLYVQQDMNDRKNTKGVSIAIAHVSNVETGMVILETTKRGETPSDMLLSMAREEGFMQYMSVAHLDEASDEQINLLLDSVVKTFLEKYPPPGKE